MRMVTIIKSITAVGLFQEYPKIKKKKLLCGNFWTSGYYANTVGKHNNEKAIKEYVQNQGKNMKKFIADNISYSAVYPRYLNPWIGVIH